MRRVTPVALALFGVFSLGLANFHHTPVASAETAFNDTVNFQARLQTAAGGIVPDNNYNIQFKLYDVDTGGTALWTESYLNDEGKGLSTVNGYFSTRLGSRNAFPNDVNWSHKLWITMNIGGTGNTASYDGEMNPRMALTAIPYAFQANTLAMGNSDGSLKAGLRIQAPTVGNQDFYIKDQGATGSYQILTENEAEGSFVMLQGASPVNQSGSIKVSGGGIFGTGLQTGGDITSTAGALILSGTGTSNYISPNGVSIASKINIANFDPGNYGQVIALGLPGSASSSARVLTVLDARSSAHQPSIALLSPNESEIGGLSWDGSNSTMYLKTTTSTLGFVSGGSVGATLYTGSNGVSTNSVLNLGAPSSTNGNLQFSNSSSSSTVSITGTGVTSSYTINLPNGPGTAGQCLSLGSVSGSVQNLDYASCGGGATPFVQGGNSFGAAGVIGTSDYNELDLMTDGHTRLTVSANGNVTLASGSSLFLQGTASISNTQGYSNSEAFGLSAAVGGSNATAVGNSASASQGGTALGHNAATSGYGASIAVGLNAVASDWSISIGEGATNTNQHGISIGAAAGAGFYGVALGEGATAAQYSVAIGAGATTTGNNQVVIGGSTANITRMIVGNGVSSGTPVGFTLQSTSGSGTDISGADINIASGQSTGSGSGGNLNFQVSNTSGSGSTLNTLHTVLALNGSDGSALFKGNTTSATAFQIQSSTGANFFTVDTTSAQKIVIGPSAGDTAGTILVLGKKTTSGDPTAVDGAMYYNTSSNSFRCGVSGVWVSCIGGLLTASTAINSSVANTTTETDFATTYSIPANYCANNRVLRVTANGLYGTTGTPNMNLRVKLGGTTVAIADTPAMTTQTSKGWTTTFTLMCPSAAGSSAAVTAQGLLTMANDPNRQIPYTSTNIATNTAQTLSISAEWGTANASNTITLSSLTVEGMGP